jgi:hypothetical protein
MSGGGYSLLSTGGYTIFSVFAPDDNVYAVTLNAYSCTSQVYSCPSLYYVRNYLFLFITENIH